MGGGGFMQHASDTNRKDRAQKSARREKFSGNHSDKTTFGEAYVTKLDFSHLTSEEIARERQRIESLRIQRKKKNIIIFIISTVITTALLIWLYNSLTR